jgi:hypothetical protein
LLRPVGLDVLCCALLLCVVVCACVLSFADVVLVCVVCVKRILP